MTAARGCTWSARRSSLVAGLRCRCVAPEFWVTLGNYIGLYSSSRSAWCCSPASPA